MSIFSIVQSDVGIDRVWGKEDTSIMNIISAEMAETKQKKKSMLKRLSTVKHPDVKTNSRGGIFIDKYARDDLWNAYFMSHAHVK